MSRGEQGPSLGSSTAIENAAVARGWQVGGSRIFHEYEPRGSVYDSNRDTDNKYDPVISDSDFIARVYLDTEPGFNAKISVNLGAQKDFLPEDFVARGEEVSYRLNDSGLEVQLRDGKTDIDRALEEVEKLAELLSEGSMERWVDSLERLERV